MKITEINIDKVENGVVVRYWDAGIEKTKVFNDNKKLFEFVRKQLKDMIDEK